jgi:hypothetical protein
MGLRSLIAVVVQEVQMRAVKEIREEESFVVVIG